MDLTGSSALVTGGASGLGLATARRLVAAGAHVVPFDLPRSPGAAVAAEIGSQATFVPGDVTASTDVLAALDAAPAPLPWR